MSVGEVSEGSRRFATKVPFYYGWIVLPIAAIAMTATLPGRTHGLGLITKPMLIDLKIDEISFGIINFWSIVLGAVFCWPIGHFIDRFGARIVLTIVAAALGLVVILTGWVSGPATLFIALALTRGLGQGALSVTSTTLVGKWFSRNVGSAMGIFAVMLAMGFIGSIWWMGDAIKRFGWREAWVQMGWLLLVGLVPLAWLLCRSTPESENLAVDNGLSDCDRNDPRIDLPLSAALTSPAFWVYSSASCLFNFAWSAITLFNESILNERGFSRDYVYLTMAIITGVGLAANLVGGWMSTRWPLGRVLGLGMLLFTASMLCFPWVTSVAQLVGYAIAFGLASGLITVVHFTFHPRAFGRTHLGKIQGTYQALSVFVSALGPLVLAIVKARTGSYQTLYLVTAPLSLALTVAAITVPFPIRPVQNSTTIPVEGRLA